MFHAPIAPATTTAIQKSLFRRRPAPSAASCTGRIVMGKGSFSSSAHRRRTMEFRQRQTHISAPMRPAHARAGSAQALRTCQSYASDRPE